jgi:hypothetical protein
MKADFYKSMVTGGLYTEEDSDALSTVERRSFRKVKMDYKYHFGIIDYL